MSEYMLPIGLVATFVAVSLLVVGLQQVMTRRRRAVQLLQAQLEQNIPVTREEDLSRSFRQRALVPTLETLGKLGTRVTPVGMRRRIARKLVLAGNPPAWTADRVAATKVLGAACGVVLGWVMASMFGFGGLLLAGSVLLLGGIGSLIPGATLDMKAKTRQEMIRRALPDTMDLLTISVEAGLGFDAALAHVRKKVPGPLSDEIGRMLHEMQLGVSRVEAFRHLADRTDVEELKAFVLSMVQADTFGISVGKVLRAQAKELRMKRRQRAEEAAMKVPVKMLFPLIFCILPAMFIVMVGPGVIRIMRAFSGAAF